MRATFIVALLMLVLGNVEGHRPHDEVASLTVSQDGNTLFAIVREAVLRSTDSGKSWQWRGHGLDYRKLEVYISPTFAVDSRVFLHDKFGVHRSDDGGDAFQLLPGSPISWDMTRRMVFSPNGTMVACGLVGGVRGMYFSTNAGANWTKTSWAAGCTAIVATKQGIIFANREKVYAMHYTNFQSFRTLQTMGTTKEHVQEIEVVRDDTETHVLLGTNFDASLLKVNMGTRAKISWTSLSFATSGMRTFSETHKAPFSVGSHAGIWYILPPAGSFFLRSDDAGLSWTKLGVDQGVMSDPQAETYPSTQFRSVHGVLGTSKIFLAAFNGLHLSVDNGKTWGVINTLDSQFTSIAAACADTACDNWVLGACTYTAGCIRATVNKAILEHPANDPADAASLIPTHQVSGYDVEYTVTAFSRTYPTDGVEFKAMGCRLRSSSDNWKSFKTVAFSSFHMPSDKCMVNHVTIASDTDIFVTGYNLGVRRSTDKGATFNLYPQAPHGTLHLVVSDKWTQDRTMAASVANQYKSAIGNLSWTIGSEWYSIPGSSGVWMDLAVFRGTHSQYPVVIGMKPVGDLAENTHEIWRTDSSMQLVKLDQTPFVPFRPQGFAERSLLLEPVASETDSRRMFVSFLGGGARSGTVQFDTAALVDETDANPPINSTNLAGSAAGPFLIDSLSPRAGSSRSTGPVVAFSPNFLADGVMFASGYHTILVSMDKGRNWHDIITLPQTLQGAACEANCLYCKLTQPSVCLECATGFRRSAYSVAGATWKYPFFNCVPDEAS